MKILSLNCWLFPFRISKDNEERLDRIINIIKKEDPNIVALQEVWSRKYVEKIKEELPSYDFFDADSFGINKSGLLTGFKEKPRRFEQGFFDITLKHNITEVPLKKGYHLFETEKFTFINTHLYASIKNRSKSIKYNQLKKVLKLADGNVILAGDLNVDEEKLKKFNKDFRHNDSFEYTHVKANKYSTAGFNWIECDKKIDYVLVKGDPEVETRLVEETVENPISDHYALVSDVSVK